MVVTQTTTVLHPASEDVARHRLADRLPSLHGTTVGLIDNSLHNSNVYLEELGRVLQERYGVTRTVTYSKPNQSVPVPSEVMDELARECDAIVGAVAD